MPEHDEPPAKAGDGDTSAADLMRKIGIVGCGEIAASYATCITASHGGKIRRVFDVDQDRARTLAAEVGAETAASLDELLNDDDVAIVVNLSPPHLHRSITEQCLNRGRWVPLMLSYLRGFSLRSGCAGTCGRKSRWP